ncbi:MAG: hypothetical protein NZ518_01500 [Dehalococcoidia bacterium]|nr:hypothetical protein [Dehalococcoidia bacterium]
MPPLDVARLFDVGRWFEVQPGPASLWYVILAAIVTTGLAAGVYAYVMMPKYQFRDDEYHAMLARNIGQGLIWLCGAALFVITFRILDVGLFGMRLWLVIMLLIGLGLLGYLIYYFRTVYPERIAVLREQERRATHRRHHH